MKSIDDLIYERSNAYRQKSAYEMQLSTTDDKIYRLRVAVKQVDDIKDSLCRLSTFTIDLENIESWKGNKFSNYQGEISGLSEAIRSYAMDVDWIHDQMNMELSRLENEARNLHGLIGNLVSWINNLGTQIENYFN